MKVYISFTGIYKKYHNTIVLHLGQCDHTGEKSGIEPLFRRFVREKNQQRRYL